MTDAKPLHFYIIDDDPDMTDFMAAMLEKVGHKVTSTNCSITALKGIVKTKPDCVLVDLMMPGKDGLELVRELHDNKVIDAKVIVVSGKPYEFDRKRAYEFGADGYINKPLNAQTFVKKINRIIEDRMEMKFWGVRGTLPVPGEKSLRYGGNTSCVTLEFSKGQFFIFDAGTGIKSLSDDLLATNRARMEAKIFISHPHWDHINALPFFAPLYVQGNEFEVLGASHGDISMREMISAQMDGIYFPIRIKQFGARVYFRNLGEEEFNCDGITIRSKLLNHPGKCLGYRVDYKGRSFCYITDNELDLEGSEFYNPFYVKRLTEFVHGTDVLITDSTYTDEEYPNKIGWGHSSIGEVTKLAHQAQVKNLYIVHHDPDQDDDDIDAKLEQAKKHLSDMKSSVICHAPTEGTTVQI